MTDVLFISSGMNIGKISHGIHNCPPIGLLYLAASLKAQNILVDVLDLLVNALSLEEIKAYVREKDPKIVAFSSTTPQIKATVEICRELKHKFPDKHFAIGGHHICNDLDFIDRYPFFDFSVSGDGEITFPLLVKKILAGEKIKGKHEGELVKNVDDFPFPDYSYVDLKRYEEIGGMKELPILGTRGCPYNCVFCSRASHLSQVRFRSAKSIVDEMEKYQGLYNGQYTFQDESFTLKKELVLKMCQEIKNRNLKVKWGAGGVRLDQLDEELLKAMESAGCTRFFIGIESGNERVRKEIVGKPLTDEQIITLLKTLDKYSFEIELSFVIGLPGETLTNIEETVMFARKLIDKGIRNINQIGIKPAIPMPGARIFKKGIEEGKIPKDIIDRYISGEYGEDFWTNWPKYIPDGISLEQIYALRKKGYEAFYFTPQYIWFRIKKDLKSWQLIKRDIKEALNIITRGRSVRSFSS